MQKEIEAKFFINSKDDIRGKLKNIGLKLLFPEFLMKRKCYGIKDSDKFFRVRQEYNRIVMTCKDIVGKNINDVYETEIIVNDFDKACEILLQTGLPLKSYQESYREVWSNEDVEVVIDTWPYLQPYIEIEAENEKVVRNYTDRLGFDFENALFGGVGVLYEKQYKISNKEVNNIPVFTFDNEELLKTLNKNILSE
jgi:adenylate cyclase class 2